MEKVQTSSSVFLERRIASSVPRRPSVDRLTPDKRQGLQSARFCRDLFTTVATEVEHYHFQCHLRDNQEKQQDHRHRRRSNSSSPPIEELRIQQQRWVTLRIVFP
jgi:hypothetical protein